jgi:hypothetical protein
LFIVWRHEICGDVRCQCGDQGHTKNNLDQRHMHVNKKCWTTMWWPYLNALHNKSVYHFRCSSVQRLMWQFQCLYRVSYANNVIMGFHSEDDATGTHPVCNRNTIVWMTYYLPQTLKLGSIKSQWGNALSRNMENEQMNNPLTKIL